VPQFELAWLFRIARNVCYNSRDSSSRRGRIETARDLDALQDVLATPERGVGVSIGELTRALGSIPERQRRALLLREFQGLSYEEIAAELGVSVAAVETLLFRARRAVAERLEQSERARRRGAIAALVAFFRWPFQGGVAPLKLAAITAAVATTATVAVAPLVGGHERSPAPAPVRVERPVVVSGADAGAVDATKRGNGERTGPSKTPASQLETSKPSAVSPSASSSPTSAATRPPAAPPLPSSDSGTDVTLPEITVPSVEVQSVTIPPLTTPEVTVTVPEISLPSLDVPEIELPALSSLP
jgi:hypothetical protein